MATSRSMFAFALAAVLWGCVLGLQRPPPRYSQQYMPQTSFTCRNKIVGSYYADPETDCQLFHVCVSVAGSIQDYRFLCPNDTAFDQESQTCADWYDVDCEAATLYYASDNFDLYRIGSGLESLHYDSIRSDYEPQDHLQRSESNDPIRSPLNSFNSNSYKSSESAIKKSNTRVSDNSQHSSRHQKQTNSEAEKEKQFQEPEKKNNFRKISRKPANNAYTTKLTTTLAPQPAQTQNRYIGQSFSYSATSQRPVPTHVTLNTQKAYQATTTVRPTTLKYSQTSARSTANIQDVYTTYQTTTGQNTYNSFNNFNRFETTAKPTNPISTHYPEPQSYSAQPTQVASSSTTKQPALDNYQANNYNINHNTNNNHNNYNHHNNNNYNSNSNYNNDDHYNNNNYYSNHNYHAQKTNLTTHAATTVTPTTYEPTYQNHNYKENSYSGSTYAPTTYSPVTRKFPSQRQYFEKPTPYSGSGSGTSSGQSDSTKASKKPTQFKSHENYETSTRSYEFGRASVGLGFSPSSVNHLAEKVRPTTPSPRRAGSPTTYKPSSFAGQLATQAKSSYAQAQKQPTSTAKQFEEAQTTPPRAKISKKNDYDYAYYDNGPLEYDNLELEHVTSNKESVKIL